MTTQYQIKLNGHTSDHKNYESAVIAWDRISSAVEDGRSIIASFWEHTRHDWDDDFYQGLIDPSNQKVDAKLFTVFYGQCIISRQCIAVLDFP